MFPLSNFSPSGSPGPSPLGALLSAFLPGLGQLSRGHPAHMAWVLMTGGFLGAIAWGLGLVGGPGAQIFFAILILPPWWCIQAYEAYQPTPPGQLQTLRIAWKQAHDIRYLGGLFLVTAFTDLYIILANPDYQLAVFCEKPTGVPGIFAKAQSPLLHIAIGYGFLSLRRWSFFVYLAYAGFGLLNAAANFACFGFGRIRTVFFISLLAFTVYVVWRRGCFLEKQ